MKNEAFTTVQLHNARCSYCSNVKMCRSFIVVHGMSGFTEKDLCSDCEQARKHQADINDMNLSNAMKEDLDGYPND